MEKTVESPNYHVYGEDLKSMIYLCKNNDRDLLLLKSLLKKYISDGNKKLVDYHFGPEVMRLFYIYKEPMPALELIQNDETKKIFMQVTSYTILMDNLFHHGHYEEIISLFHELLCLKLTILPVPKDPAYLTIAACFKLNTEKSFHEAISIMDKCNSLRVNLNMMFYCFIAALAINLGKFTTALEVLSRPTSNNPILFNLKAIALARNKYPEMAATLLDEIYALKKFNSTKLVLLETINIIEMSFKEAGNDLTDSKFIKLKQALENEGLINYETLDTVLCEDEEDSGLLGKSDNFEPHHFRMKRRERLAASFMQKDWKEKR